MATSLLTASHVALRPIPYWFTQEVAQFFGILKQTFLITVSHHGNSRSIADDNVHFIGVNIPWPRRPCLSFDEFNLLNKVLILHSK